MPSKISLLMKSCTENWLPNSLFANNSSNSLPPAKLLLTVMVSPLKSLATHPSSMSTTLSKSAMVPSATIWLPLMTLWIETMLEKPSRSRTEAGVNAMTLSMSILTRMKLSLNLEMLPMFWARTSPFLSTLVILTTNATGSVDKSGPTNWTGNINPNLLAWTSLNMVALVNTRPMLVWPSTESMKLDIWFLTTSLMPLLICFGSSLAKDPSMMKKL